MICMVEAVPIKEQAPQLGQALHFAQFSFSSLISPRSNLAEYIPSLVEAARKGIAEAGGYGARYFCTDICDGFEVFDWSVPYVTISFAVYCVTQHNLKYHCFQYTRKIHAFSSDLASGQLNQAEELLRQLHRLIEQKECTKEFSQRMRRAIAYQNLGLAIQKGEKIDVSILERDFSTSHSPLHKLDVQYQVQMA